METSPSINPQTAAPAKRRSHLLKWILRILALLLAAGLTLAALSCYAKPQLYGNFMPNFDFNRGEKLYKKLEADRAAQKSGQPAATPADPAELARLLALPAWPSYRGPSNDGLSPETGLLASWPEAGPPMLYRQPVGGGWAGFSIGLARAFTIEQRRDKEAVACYDLKSGRELWVFDYPAAFSESMGGDGPRSTPTLSGGRVYALGALGALHCLDALTGAKVWGVNILEATGGKNLYYGAACSPLPIGDRLYVTASGEGGADSLLCLALADGKVLWKSFPQKQAYTSLILADVAGAPTLVNLSGKSLNGLDPADGRALWSFPWEVQNDINCSQPVVVSPERVFVSSGYGKGCALVEIKSDGGKMSAGELWSNTNMKNKFNASVASGGYLYGLDEGILACIDLATGKRMWKGGRLGHGQLLWAEGNLVVAGEKGDIYLVKASPDGYQEVGRAEALHGKTWNPPALADGLLLVRNDKEMACFDLKKL